MILFRFGSDSPQKGNLHCFVPLSPWLTPKSRLTGHLKCSAFLHPIVYFTSKQRSLSGLASHNVPILFRACVGCAICREFRAYSGALICSALLIDSWTSRHNFVTFSPWLTPKSRLTGHLKCSVFGLKSLKTEVKCTNLFRFMVEPFYIVNLSI